MDTPHFLFVGNKIYSTSLTFSEGRLKTVTNQGRKGMQKKRSGKKQ